MSRRIIIAAVAVVILLLGIVFFCRVPRGVSIPFYVPADLPEKPGLTEIKVDPDHQMLDGTKSLSYRIGPYDGLVIDLSNHKNERFKGVPANAVEVLQVMDGHRMYIIKMKPEKRRYVLLPDGLFLEKGLGIFVGYLEPDPKSIKTYPTWAGYIVVDPKLMK